MCRGGMRVKCDCSCWCVVMVSIYMVCILCQVCSYVHFSSGTSVSIFCGTDVISMCDIIQNISVCPSS